MDLHYSAAELAFRDEIRRWLTATVPTLPSTPAIEDWPARRRFDTAWQHKLFSAGYAGIDWPTEFGGRGGGPVEQLIFLAECERAHAPYGMANYVGVNHAGPTIMLEGTEEQQRRFLPPILRGEHVWCQGFSEPGAGSDLASLRTRAVREGDYYVVTGQKIWTSHSPVADFCELLVRTDPDAPKHKGISWLALPLDSPGVTIRPLRTIIGTSDFAEVFLDEVRVPAANRIGPENDGWRVAMVTLGFERGTAYANELFDSRVQLAELAALARATSSSTGEVSMWDDAGLRREIGRLTAQFDGMWALLRRNVAVTDVDGRPGVDASIFKLHFTELRQQLTELVNRILGPASLAMDPLVPGLAGSPDSGHYVTERLRVLSLTIAGGTSEIQRNIIAERGLGLPRG
jgi:alkylation response protein AidB-like acyl-CoA dehydrogenase